MSDAPSAPKKHRRPHIDAHEGGHGGGEHGGEEGWLVSYADMMTLLVGFFVILLSFSKVDDEKFEEAKKSVSKEFGGKYEAGNEDIANKLRDKLNQMGMGDQIEVKNTASGVQISFMGTVFFVPGSADVKDDGQKLLKELLGTIKETAAGFRVVVEGHTDDVPLGASSIYKNNWELSSIRSCRVLDFFANQGFDKGILTAIGYGETKPIAPNRDDQGHAIPENQAKNRRVVIKLVKGEQASL